MKDIYIIGSGDIAKFIAYNFDLFGLENHYLKGFLDNDKSKIGTKLCGFDIFDIDVFLENDSLDIDIIIAIASPRIKLKVYNEFKDKGVGFPNLISNNSWISNNVNLGNGIIIYPNSSIEHKCEINDFVIINCNSSIGHNTIIEDFSTIAPGVHLAGFTYICSGVDFGIGACTRQKVRIGKNSVVGGQAMLVKDVEDNSVVVGVPAKKLLK